MSEVVNIYTDGACRSNPGPGGWAVVILTSRDANFTIQGRDPNSTNNRMELTAAIKGLQGLDYWVPEPRDLPVILHSDSKYLTDAFNQNWLGKWQRNGWSTSTGKLVSNRELWEELLVLTKQRNITWQWVKGHSGNHFSLYPSYRTKCRGYRSNYRIECSSVQSGSSQRSWLHW